MIIIWLDTNAVLKNQLLGSVSDSLRDLAADGVCEIRISPVVASELERLWKSEIEDLATDVGATIDKYGTRFVLDASALSDAVSLFASASERDVSRRINEMKGLGGVSFVRDIPRVSVADLLSRDIENRRPFTLTAEKTTGMRDALIWEGLMEQVRAHPDARFVFVTNDTGFLSPKPRSGLHPDLVRDLDGDESDGSSHAPILTSIADFSDTLPSARVFHAKDLYETTTMVKRFAAMLSENEATARDTFDLVIEDFEEQDWQPGTIVFERTPVETDFPIGFCDISVEHVDRALEVEVTATSEVRYSMQQTINVFFSGLLEKSDWYAHEDSGELELWNPDFNDHYVQVSLQREFRIEADIRIEPGNRYGELIDGTLDIQ